MHPTPVHCHHIAYGSRNNDTVGVTYCSHKYCWSLLQGHFRGPWRNVDFSEKYSPLPTWNGDLNFSEWGPNGYLILSEMGIFSSRNGDQMGTKCGPEKRIFDKLTKTSWFIEINEWSSAALWNALRTKNGIMWEKLNIRTFIAKSLMSSKQDSFLATTGCWRQEGKSGRSGRFCLVWFNLNQTLSERGVSPIRKISLEKVQHSFLKRGQEGGAQGPFEVWSFPKIHPNFGMEASRIQWVTEKVGPELVLTKMGV